MRTATFLAALTIIMPVLAGCGTDSLKTNIFGSSAPEESKKDSALTAIAVAANNDTPCPNVQVRTGASTLMIGSKREEGEPSPLDVRYQGSIINMARECHLNAGLLTVKVGVEGRVITGPKGGPGTVDVPLRIAVVKEGINPTTIATKFSVIPVTINNAVDRVTFTHVEPDISFPIPARTSDINSYVIYVGFDALGERQQRKKPARRSRARQ